MVVCYVAMRIYQSFKTETVNIDLVLYEVEQQIFGRSNHTCDTAFALTWLSHLYLNQVKLQPIKSISFVGLTNQKGPIR